MGQLSYWERDTWFSNVDFTVIGSGIVGLNCALSLREKHPKAKIIIIDKGILPEGASTKNAGFSCFGSISEIVADLKSHSPEEVTAIVKKRWEGVNTLRKTLGDKNIGYESYGGHEVFLEESPELFNSAKEKLDEVNKILYPIFKSNCFHLCDNSFHFKGVLPQYISSSFEGQIDTGLTMKRLIEHTQSQQITIIYGLEVLSYEELNSQVSVQCADFEFKTNQLFLATNGFASQLLQEDVLPARAQVLITKPIKDLHIKGVFHMDEGYYYFRNVGNRILFGGARNLDIEGETSTEFKTTSPIMDRLEDLLEKTIAPNYLIEIDMRWSGIMGVGKQKAPIVKELSSRVFCGVRLGGMGVAIGSAVGQDLAALLD